MSKRKDLSGQRFGRLIVIKRSNRVDASRHSYWWCVCDCGKSVEVRGRHLISGHTVSCGCFHRDITSKINKIMKLGPKNPQWKGGRKLTSDGYMLIYSPDHPAAQRKGYVLEHRLVMEKKLGRPLRPEEVVHHIDGDPANNAEANLDLFPSKGKHSAYHRKLELVAEET